MRLCACLLGSGGVRRKVCPSAVMVVPRPSEKRTAVRNREKAKPQEADVLELWLVGRRVWIV